MTDKLHSGKKTGHAVDPNKYSAQNEKFTDKLRAWVEKVTGKKACGSSVLRGRWTVLMRRCV